MVLADTSVWVSHLRKGNTGLEKLLEKGAVLCHPFVTGELACGNLANRNEILELLRELPQAPAALDEEVMRFIERRGLMGRGLGFVDVHLLASALLASAPLWTLDRILTSVADELGIRHRRE